MLKLLELVYEGGDVLDLALVYQRRYLKEALGTKFLSVNMRGMGRPQRLKTLKQLQSDFSPENILLRGATQVDEVCRAIPGSDLVIDYLARTEEIEPNSLIRWSPRILRVLVYSIRAENVVRDGGVGRITKHFGPFLPDMYEPPPRDTPVVVGMLDLGTGAREASVRLKNMAKKCGWQFDFVSTLKGSYIIRAESAMEVAEMSDFLICPMDQPDLGGPHEAAILALSVGRVLCTYPTAAMHRLAMYRRSAFIPYEVYRPGTAAQCFETFRQRRDEYQDRVDSVRKSERIDPHAVPEEVLRRIR